MRKDQDIEDWCHQYLRPPYDDVPNCLATSIAAALLLLGLLSAGVKDAKIAKINSSFFLSAFVAVAFKNGKFRIHMMCVSSDFSDETFVHHITTGPQSLNQFITSLEKLLLSNISGANQWSTKIQ